MTNSRPPPLKMVAASFCIPKYDPTNPRGDDAHFIAANEQFIGVADGVSGWRKKGIDSGEYARQLMNNSVLSLTHNNNNNVKKSPKQVLKEAYSKTAATQGSSTACIVSFSGEKRKLRAANVGDSGFLVIRNGAVVYRSRAQQHSFNYPYQLGPANDDPSVAEEIEVGGVEKGDLVLLGTDGVWDNMPEAKVLEIVAKKGNGLDLEKQCCVVALVALSNSHNRNIDTPFSIAAKEAGKHHEGGKIDDITLVIARIE